MFHISDGSIDQFRDESSLTVFKRGKRVVEKLVYEQRLVKNGSCKG